MIVFKDYRKEVSYKECQDRVFATYSELNETEDVRDKVFELCIAMSEFETGVADSFCFTEDFEYPFCEMFRKATALTGLMFVQSWLYKNIDPATKQDLHEVLLSILNFNLPQTIKLSIMEGFAYYSLYPETYLLATQKFFQQVKPKSVLVVGLRTIGTCLSSIVEATLKISGCDVKSYTFRPHGHPYDRLLHLRSELQNELKERNDSYIIIVDEGPGLSGSSFGGTAEELTKLGFSDDKIIYFPSWEPDGNSFLSETARLHWGKHYHYSTSFEEALLSTDELLQKFRLQGLEDISAGNWRKRFIPDERDFPAVHPYHERRKYLGVTNNNSCCILKFAGLGRYGKQTLRKAEQLASSGLTPEPINFANGFIAFRYLDGYSVKLNNDKNFLEVTSTYLTFLKNNFPGQLTAPFDKMVEMITVNVKEGLGERWYEKVKVIESFSKQEYESEIVAVDGRLLPYKWVKSNGLYIKTDHTDHCADQFFPGCQRIEWDVAGFLIENKIDSETEGSFLNSMVDKTKDKSLLLRLPFYLIAYSAFRMGYATMACESLGGSLEVNRFEVLRDYYRRYLLLSIDQFTKNLQ